MEKKKEIRLINPMSSVDYGEILDKWNDSFNSDISNPTDKWRLAAYPVMPGNQTTRAALIFEQKIGIGGDGCNILYKYRILLYDMTVTASLISGSEFQFKDWQVYTAWFFNGKLYAAMRADDNFSVITIQGDGNERIIKLGGCVTKICPSHNGDILVGYDCCVDDADNRQPIILYRRLEENKSLCSDDAISCEAMSYDGKGQIWAYVKPYNYICRMSGDQFDTFPIKMSGFSGLGASDDGKVLLTSMNYRYYGSRLYAFRLNEEEEFDDAVEVVLDTGDDEKDDDRNIDGISFAGGKALIRKGSRKLYMVNINELTWEEMRSEEYDKKNDSKEG